MFSMERIGQKISELRKARNMTQMELADKMNISFQAVSNWERGISMPDISKLPELAEIFGVTIDEMLGGNSELLDSIVNEKTEDYLQKNAVSVDEFKEIAPIIKPHQADTIFKNVKPTYKLSDLVDILPFINRDTLNRIVMKFSENSNYDGLDAIAPFVDKNLISDIARKMIADGRSIADIAPFVTRDVISELAMILYNNKGLSALGDIAPFIPRNIMDEIAGQEFEKNGLKNFHHIAPFVNRTLLNELAQKAMQNDGIKAVRSIAPFLDRNMLTDYIKEIFL